MTPISFTLLGLYTYEGWSLTCQRVYNFIQTIRASAEFSAYHPAICWPSYIDVVTRFPACPYYDAVTSGILWRIRAAHDKPSLSFSMQVIEKHQDQFMYWGPKFEDYSPIIGQKAMANVSWLSQLFLNYEEQLTPFTRILRSKGENVLLYLIRQAAESVSYGEPLEIKAVVSPTRVEEVFIEPCYLVNDYITVYAFTPLRQHYKIRRKGEDYEILGVQAFDFQGETAYLKANCRRLIGRVKLRVLLTRLLGS